ncbi:hypothetical protein ABE527_02475 [Brucella sp. TWI432]
MAKPKPIGEALLDRIDRELHADLLDYADCLISESNDHAPRLDTGERFINVEERIEEYRIKLMEQTQIYLRPVYVDYNHDKGYHAVIEPRTQNKPASYGNKGD